MLLARAALEARQMELEVTQEQLAVAHTTLRKLQTALSSMTDRALFTNKQNQSCSSSINKNESAVFGRKVQSESRVSICELVQTVLNTDN
jgi:flagellar capping protein FliD